MVDEEAPADISHSQNDVTVSLIQFCHNGELKLLKTPS